MNTGGDTLESNEENPRCSHTVVSANCQVIKFMCSQLCQYSGLSTPLLVLTAKLTLARNFSFSDHFVINEFIHSVRKAYLPGVNGLIMSLFKRMLDESMSNEFESHGYEFFISVCMHAVLCKSFKKVQLIPQCKLETDRRDFKTEKLSKLRD